MAKYELEITIRPQDVDKRHTLASRIDMALATSGCRITAGEYDVIIMRKTAAQVRRDARSAVPPEASEKEEAVPCPVCGRWWCTRPACTEAAGRGLAEVETAIAKLEETEMKLDHIKAIKAQ